MNTKYLVVGGSGGECVEVGVESALGTVVSLGTGLNIPRSNNDSVLINPNKRGFSKPFQLNVKGYLKFYMNFL